MLGSPRRRELAESSTPGSYFQSRRRSDDAPHLTSATSGPALRERGFLACRPRDPCAKRIPVRCASALASTARPWLESRRFRAPVRTPMANPKYLSMNGEIVPFADAKIHTLTPGVKYGTAVFEGIRGYWNERRKDMYLFRLEEHLNRLHFSMKVMRFEHRLENQQMADRKSVV